MADKLKFIEATLFTSSGSGGKKIFVPIQAIVSLEKDHGSSTYSINFSPDYNFGVKGNWTSVNANISADSIEILK